MSAELTTEQSTALDHARAMAGAGIPVFVVHPDDSPVGFRMPKGWQNTSARPAYVNAWKPGLGLCAVMGHGLDLVDLDPRNGADIASLNGAMPTTYGIAATPSDGWHGFVKSLGVRSRDNVAPGIDVKAGDPDGQGRGFAFIAPTVRASKVTGELVAYRWTTAPDLAALKAAADDRTGEKLAAMVRVAHGSRAAAGEDAFSWDAFNAGPWDDIAKTLLQGRHDGVHQLAAALRGRGGWRVGDALAYMRATVWPLINQEQGKHPYTEAEFEADITDVFTRYADGPSTPRSEAGGAAATESAEELAVRRARITWASDIEPRPVVWAWKEGEHGRIPAGSLSVAAGREGTGKSSFGMWEAANVTRGTLPGSLHGRPGRVLYVAMEDSWQYTIVPRLIAAGADLSMVGRFDVVSIDDDEMVLSLPHDNDLLEKAIVEHGVKLVLIDPIMSVLGDSINASRSREVRRALDPLAKIADRTGCLIQGIAHFNKSNGGDPSSRIQESSAFKDVPRSVFTFAKDDDGRVMSQTKNSLGRDDLPSLTYVIEEAAIPTNEGTAYTGKFTFTGESDRSVSDLLRDAGGDDDRSERDEAGDWLKGYLTDQGGSAEARDVLKAARGAGIAERTLKRAKKAAGVRSEKAGLGHWLWSLSEAIPEGGHQTLKGATSGKVAPLAPLAPFTETSDAGLPLPGRVESAAPGIAGTTCGACHQPHGNPNSLYCDTCLTKARAS